MRDLLLSALRRVLPSEWAADIVRDLEDAHRRREATTGRPTADLWLAGQTVLFAARFGVERISDLIRGPTGAGMVGSLVRDVRHTLRSFRRSPLFLAAVALTLAVGLGANAAVFTVLRSVLLEPLPYPEPEELVVLEPYPWVPADIAVDLRSTAGSLEALEGLYPRRFAVTDRDRPSEVDGAVVTPGFLGLLGAGTTLGRGFTADDARPGADRVALLAHGHWRTRYGASPDVLGRTIRLDGVPHRIVGVVEEGFRQLTPRSGDPEIWTAAALDRLGDDVLPEGSPPWAMPVARLEPETPRERSAAELDAALRRHRDRSPETADGPRRELRWTPLRTHLTGDLRDSLLVLQAAAGLLLLLTCVNVANLFLVRLLSRRTETAVRTALGASRGRLLRQILTESAILGLVGGVAALALMVLSLDALVAMAPPDLPRLDTVSLDLPVVLAVLGASLATGLLFGLVPAVLATAPAPARSLREGSRTTTGSRGKHLLSQGLVVGQVTLTLVLVVGAGLLARSFHSLSSEEPGFRTDDVLVVRMSASERDYATVERLGAYQSRLVERVHDLPGVESVALANNVPLERAAATRLYVAEGEDAPREAQYGVVSPGYFRTLGIPLLRGRAFEAGDRRGSPRVAVIDQAMWREVWPDADPLGMRFRFVDDEEWITVVGVSASIRGSGPGRPPGPGFHLPVRQRPDTPVELGVGREMVLLVRTAGDPSGMAEPLRSAVWDVDPAQPVPEVAALGAVLARSTSPQRFRAVLVGAFAVVALLLALAGIYGVVGNLLAERIHELGIRRALGARRRDVVGTVLLWGLRLTFLGVALGLLGVAWTGRFLEGLLHGVGPADSGTVAAGVLGVVTMTVLACLVPAWRAARIDTLAAIRSE